jgi:hypothetical protein
MPPDMSLTYEIKTRVDEATGASLRHRATASGCQVSELVRDAVYLIEHGVTYGEYVAQHRRKALGLSVTDAGRMRAAEVLSMGRGRRR